MEVNTNSHQLIFDMPIAIANTMGMLNAVVSWKFLFTYTGEQTGNGNLNMNVIPDAGSQGTHSYRDRIRDVLPLSSDSPGAS